MKSFSYPFQDWHWQPTLGTPACHAIEFSADQFNDGLFAKHDIVFPPEIRRSVAKRRCEYFYGRIAARAALGSLGLTDCIILNDSSRAPVFPPGVVGSISHTNRIAMAAVARAVERQGIGLDVEHVPEVEALEALALLSMSADERCLARDLPLPFGVVATLVFSAKESVYKALSRHAGRVIGFSSIRFAGLDPLQRRMEFEVKESLCSAWKPSNRMHVAYSLYKNDTVCTMFEW